MSTTKETERRLFSYIRQITFFEMMYLLVSIAGFFLIWRTLDATKKSIHYSVYLQMTNWTRDLDRDFIEHPELVRYFTRGDSIAPSDTNYIRAHEMAQQYLDDFDAILANKSYFDIDNTDDSKEPWINWINDCFSHSPILCQKFEETERWYTPELKKTYEAWKLSRHTANAH